MKKKNFVIILFLLSVGTLFARQSLDEAISEACTDIIKECSQKSYLAMNNIEIPRIVVFNIKSSYQMSSYIREEISNILVKNKNINVISDTESIAILDRVLKEQHQSGRYDETTIVNYARRVGANLVISGSVMERYDVYTLSLEMTVVETATHFWGGKYDFFPDKKTEQFMGRAATYSKAAMGIGAELNGYSYNYFAPACSVSLDYNISRKISLGIKMIGSYNIDEKDINFLEPLGYLRLYLASPSGEPGAGIFVEGLGGASIFLNDSAVRTVVANGGGGFGYRFATRNFYIDLAIRGGYPYLFGVGLSTGFRF
ncbi:MAG: hypothetical protein E7062_01570 [Spirochaetaceae bacterium]|nr:hypothetical protein [Spirochaetaceae bacterium]